MDGNVVVMPRIARAHLNEFADNYSRAAIEAEAEAYWAARVGWSGGFLTTGVLSSECGGGAQPPSGPWAAALIGVCPVNARG